MVTSLADDANGAEGVRSDAGPHWTRAEWLWLLFGLALLVTFLFFVVDDYSLRNLIAVR